MSIKCYIRDLQGIVIYSMLAFYLRVEHNKDNSQSVKMNKRLFHDFNII